MIYTLMNKNAELFDIELINGHIHKVENFCEENKKLLPVFLINENNENNENLEKNKDIKRVAGKCGAKKWLAVE